MKFLWIGLGGGLGSLARHGVELGLARGGSVAATLTVNVLGSFAIGLAWIVLEARGALDSALRFALVTGFLGGFTTYSTFNHQTLELARSRGWGAASLSVVTTVATCLLAGGLGAGAGRWLVRP
jgi:CrcB protein